MDHVSSIFTLDPTHTIKLKEHSSNQPLALWQHNQSLNNPDHHRQIAVTHQKQISARQQNRSDISQLQQTLFYHTRFSFTDPAYICAFMHINPRIPLHILQKTLTGHTRFSFIRSAYTRAFTETNQRILLQTFQRNSSEHMHSSDITLYFRNMFASSQIRTFHKQI